MHSIAILSAYFWLASAIYTDRRRGVGAVIVRPAVAARRQGQAGLWRRGQYPFGQPLRVGQADPPGDAQLPRHGVLLGAGEVHPLLTVSNQDFTPKMFLLLRVPVSPSFSFTLLHCIQRPLPYPAAECPTGMAGN